MSYSLQAECGVANLVIRFLNYTFVSFFFLETNYPN